MFHSVLISLIRDRTLFHVKNFFNYSSQHDATQGMQCMYNATLRRVRATTLVVEKQWVLHSLRVCICSLRCPACNAHAPYCHLWPVRLYYIFSTLSHKGGNVRKKNNSWTSKCVFWFDFNVSFYKELMMMMIKNLLVFTQSTRYSCQILMKYGFSRQYSNIKFHRNPSTGSPVVPYGRTDGRDE